jgi:CRISPR/Cas system type I-B associated protein Csh2 (Cas7 group RAMP superfamily)
VDVYFPVGNLRNSGISIPGSMKPFKSVQMQILLDITRISKVLRLTEDQIRQIEYHIRRLIVQSNNKCSRVSVSTLHSWHFASSSAYIFVLIVCNIYQIQDIFLHHTEYDLCQQSTSVQMQILLDITRISKVLRLTDDQIRQIEYQIRRLIR